MNPKLPLAIATLLVALTSSILAQEVKPVAIATTIDTPAKYVTMVSGGLLDTSATTINARQLFIIDDANGGELADGDDVQIRTSPGGGVKDTYWQETPEKVSRIGDKKTKEINFKIKKQKGGISIQTFSGKFIAVAPGGGPLNLTDALENATVFQIVKDPPMPTPTPAPAP